MQLVLYNTNSSKQEHMKLLSLSYLSNKAPSKAAPRLPPPFFPALLQQEPPLPALQQEKIPAILSWRVFPVQLTPTCIIRFLALLMIP